MVISRDIDPEETHEWLEALRAAVSAGGRERGLFLLQKLEEQAQQLGIVAHVMPYSAYQNTVPLDEQAVHPGDVALEEKITALMRWNALAMVVRANKAYGELGGHVATYASSAEIFEVGMNHFFRGPDAKGGGDLVFFQPHSAPGIYARAFLEGRISETQLANYRQETNGRGLCSYPHPWLMPDFWQFPTGSMGIGPINSIYQARFLRYLEHRNLVQTQSQRVWGIFGDGEMDEPESIGALTLAARENLDNLTFIINCNLQRLDGPVRGNGQIIQELEALFTGAGWNVVKVLWGSDWDPLFARDTNYALLKAFANTVDGQYQTLGANGGAYNQQNFFALDPELRALVAHMSMEEIDALKRGGHDLRKLYSAFSSAIAYKGKPTVILAKTKKGYGMGRAGESRMTSHQEKKLDLEALLEFRDRFSLPLTDDQVMNLEFICPAENSEELQYLRARRAELGGSMPARRCSASHSLSLPPLLSYGNFALEANEKEMSTTMAFVRLLGNLLRDKTLGPRIVPIVADEARTFGMANLFKQIGIYSPLGQLYEPEDAGSLLSYRESRDGQLLEEGITEAGALSSWVAAATSYSVHGFSLLPFYIYYSIFGFQRVGDLIWAAADQRARGFLLGATSGRTTLGGEGLQHQDGSSHLVAATIPNCRAYDPAFAGELAVILDYGARRMIEQQCDEFYYLTLMNENYAQPSLPKGAGTGVIRGMYRFAVYSNVKLDSLEAEGEQTVQSVRLLGSGAILREVISAAQLLLNNYGITSEVWSVTSFSELARDAREIERLNRLTPLVVPRSSYVQQCLIGKNPIVAATDYVRAVPQMISSYLPGCRYVVLGTDGFGRSDTRAALREFFEVDRKSVVLGALQALVEDGFLKPEILNRAVETLITNVDLKASWQR